MSTPLLRQYHAQKAQNPGTILLYRMGDFYELFYEDAKVASEVLGLTLTSRGHGKSGEVPLAGFPHHAAEGYIEQLVRAGYRVAICEQVEDPKKAKGLVKRDVIEVVSAGTALSENLLDKGKNNYLVAVVSGNEAFGLAYTDISTGEFAAEDVSSRYFRDRITALEPSEILIPADQANILKPMIPSTSSAVITYGEDWTFAPEFGQEILLRHFQTRSLAGFGIQDMVLGVGAAGALLHYVQQMRKGDVHVINRISRGASGVEMVLDEATRRNLELVSSLMGDRPQVTLLATVDRTLTPAGKRLLRQRLLRPTKDVAEINARLDAIQELVHHTDISSALRGLMKGFGDPERLVARLAGGRGSPKDAQSLGAALKRIPDLKKLLADSDSGELKAVNGDLDPLQPMMDHIGRALVDDPPSNVSAGDVIREGYDKELDELRTLRSSSRKWIHEQQKSERDRTGIPSLKIGYNQVFGYYIEVTKPHLSKVPDHYIRKQTLVNAERYITPELKEQEEKILSADEKILEREQALWDALRQEIIEDTVAIQKNSRAIARLDVARGLADLAIDKRWKRPEIHNGLELLILGGRHPVVENLLPPGESFVPNDVDMNPSICQILIITGPNMAGKSTYLRQVGLIVILAQMGSFVPADTAKIGVVDRLFTRVGASDNLAGGESTFLVEMNEVANILNNATPQSLVLLDEVGRGTSTYDGLSLAWAIAEYLHQNEKLAAKTLFATHYHELTELEGYLERVKNVNVAVKKFGDKVLFLRKIKQGGCDHSYGIDVARLAGLPATVIERAKNILSKLESGTIVAEGKSKSLAYDSAVEPHQQLPLFAADNGALKEALLKLDLDAMTPIEALKALYELKKLM
jgi:DNA mismatch repair protein MutS